MSLLYKIAEEVPFPKKGDKDDKKDSPFPPKKEREESKSETSEVDPGAGEPEEASEVPEQGASEDNANIPATEEPPTTAPVGLTAVLDFVQANQQYNPGSAEAAGMSLNELNATTYALAAKMANLIRGGLSVEKGVNAQSVDRKELLTGINIEYAHTKDEAIAKKIALDHLADIPDYYTRLTKMLEDARRETQAAAVPTKIEHNVTNEDIDDNDSDKTEANESKNIPWNTPTMDDN